MLFFIHLQTRKVVLDGLTHLPNEAWVKLATLFEVNHRLNIANLVKETFKCAITKLWGLAAAFFDRRSQKFRKHQKSAVQVPSTGCLEKTGQLELNST